MKKLFYILPLLFAVMSCIPSGDPDNPPQSVPFVDVERYSGVWYEIASYPQIFEFGCNCVTATYGIRPDGNLSVFNQCQLFVQGGPSNDIEGFATIVPNTGNAQLKVNFFGDGEFGADYWIIGLAEDYSWAMVSDPSRNTFWILSRTPDMDQDLYLELIQMAVDNGFNRQRIARMNQGC